MKQNQQYFYRVEVSCQVLGPDGHGDDRLLNSYDFKGRDLLEAKVDAFESILNLKGKLTQEQNENYHISLSLIESDSAGKERSYTLYNTSHYFDRKKESEVLCRQFSGQLNTLEKNDQDDEYPF